MAVRMNRLTAAAIGVPLATLALAGWLNWRLIENEASQRIARTSHAIAEHAQRTFRTHEVIIASIDRHIAGWRWERILGSEELNGELKRLAGSAPDLASIFVLHPDGHRFNSSRRFPMPAIDATDRDYYRALRAHDMTYISAPALGRLSSDRFFSLARPRSGEGFDGLIAVSVDPAYFEAFYATLVETPEDSVSLVRIDGTVLARYPSAPAGARVNAEAAQRSPDGGVTRLRSAVDGVERLVAFRPVGDYGVYAAFNLSSAAVWAAWRRAMLPYAGGALLAALALLYAVRRREREQAEAARQIGEQRLQRWTDAVPALVSYIDRDLRYRFNGLVRPLARADPREACRRGFGRSSVREIARILRIGARRAAGDVRGAGALPRRRAAAHPRELHTRFRCRGRGAGHVRAGAGHYRAQGGRAGP